MYSPQKGSKGRKLFGKLGTSKDDSEVVKRKGMVLSCDHDILYVIICIIPDNHKSDQASVAYQPPLGDQDVDLKRTMRKLTKLSQDAQK